MQHFLYKTTNKINGRYYIGMHSAENVDDGYLGSGKRLKAEIKKYGKENFDRVILEELPSRELLEEREREVVNAELLADPNCLNLKRGGEGGGKLWNEEHRAKWIAAGRATSETSQKAWKTRRLREADVPGYAEEISKKLSDAAKLKKTFLGKTHSEETKLKMRKSKNVGENNSQFGTCWVTDGVKPIKVPKDQLSEYIERGYLLGRKKNQPLCGSLS